MAAAKRGSVGNAGSVNNVCECTKGGLAAAAAANHSRLIDSLAEEGLKGVGITARWRQLPDKWDEAG